MAVSEKVIGCVQSIVKIRNFHLILQTLPPPSSSNPPPRPTSNPVLGLSVERSLEPRVAFLERALSSCSSSSSSSSPSSPSSSSSSQPNPLLAKVLRSSPSLLHLSLRSGEETLEELTRRLPDAEVRSRAIAAAPAMLLVGGEKLSATLDALTRVASLGLDGDADEGGGSDNKEADDELRLVSDLVRRHPALLRHAFTGPDAVMLPAADWLARLLSVEAEAPPPPPPPPPAAASGAAEAGAREEGGEERRRALPPPAPLLLLADLPPSSTPRGRALAAAAIRRCPALLGRSLSGLEGTASWLEERARAFLSSSSADSEEPDAKKNPDGAFRENRGRARSPKSANQTPLSLVAGVARRFPQAFGLARANLDAKLRFLTEEVGMSEGEAAGVAVQKMPQLLGLRLRSLRARAAFLLDGNDAIEEEEEEDEEGEEERGGAGGGKGGSDESGGGSEEERERPASASASAAAAAAVAANVEGGDTRAKKPVRGRRSASEIASFAPCLASSLEKLVARHAAAAAQRATPKKKTTKTKKKKKGEDGEQETETTTATTTTRKRTPSLSSLLACTDAVLEGRLGLPVGSLEGLKADRRVREAIERAERAAAAKEEGGGRV